MKALTIEQLKALPVGEWVWEDKSKVYEFIKDKTDEFLLTLCDGVLDRLYYSDYGTKWIAYKNKEMAEAKGEIVELPCKVGDTVYYIDEYIAEFDKVEEYTVEKIEIVEDRIRLWFGDDVGYALAENFGKEVFSDQSEAECRLAELKGESV